MSEFYLKDMSELDDVSYAEFINLITKYEDLHVVVEHRLKKIGKLDAVETYKKYDEMLAELPQGKEIRRRRAIADQIRKENKVEMILEEKKK